MTIMNIPHLPGSTLQDETVEYNLLGCPRTQDEPPLKRWSQCDQGVLMGYMDLELNIESTSDSIGYLVCFRL